MFVWLEEGGGGGWRGGGGRLEGEGGRLEGGGEVGGGGGEVGGGGGEVGGGEGRLEGGGGRLEGGEGRLEGGGRLEGEGGGGGGGGRLGGGRGGEGGGGEGGGGGRGGEVSILYHYSIQLNVLWNLIGPTYLLKTDTNCVFVMMCGHNCDILVTFLLFCLLVSYDLRSCPVTVTLHSCTQLSRHNIYIYMASCTCGL